MVSGVLDSRPVRRVQRHPMAEYDSRAWPYSLPSVAQLLRDGLDIPAGVTFLVGENGTGKSTIIEAIAATAGISAEGGSTNAQYSTRASESPLHQALQLVRSAGSSRWGYFLRAETMHGLYTYLEQLPPGPGPRQNLHERSHGESFLDVLEKHFAGPGLYLLDEPESALSFSSCLALVGVLADLAASDGTQVICASHSPILTALPGAAILELGDHGYRQTTWEELEIVGQWKRYLADPKAYLHHILD